MKNQYKGLPFADNRYKGGVQTIPGKVYCAYYDMGGEGIAYHDTTGENQGSGRLNADDGSYLHQFRMNESVDTSYTKSQDDIDNSEFNFVTPEMDMLYVGWTAPGEWLKYTVDVKNTGTYYINVMYTSYEGGKISVSVNDTDKTGPMDIQSTYRSDDPIQWRQWHHWNKADKIAEIYLEEGSQVLTLHTVANGQMNYGYLEFELK